MRCYKLEPKNVIIELPTELRQKVERYLSEEDTFGYASVDDFVKDAVRRHLEHMIEVKI